MLSQFKNEDSLEPKKHPGRPVLHDTIENRNKIRRLLNQKKSLNKISRELDIPRRTCRRIVKNLKLKPYKKRKIPLLTQKNIAQRKRFGEWCDEENCLKLVNF